MDNLSSGAQYLKQGDTCAPFDQRLSDRLSSARSILNRCGITPTIEYCRECRESYTNGGQGCDDCRTLWPEWVTDKMFQDAFDAADSLQNLRSAIRDAQLVESR